MVNPVVIISASQKQEQEVQLVQNLPLIFLSYFDHCFFFFGLVTSRQRWVLLRPHALEVAGFHFLHCVLFKCLVTFATGLRSGSTKLQKHFKQGIRMGTLAHDSLLFPLSAS